MLHFIMHVFQCLAIFMSRVDINCLYMKTAYEN